MTHDPEELRIAVDGTSEHEGPPIDTAGMMLRVKNRLWHHEGKINHMYRDTEGNVTVGVGFHLEKRSDVRWYPWISRTTRRTVPARVAEANWDTLKAYALYGTGYGAARFLDYATVEMTNAAIGFALTKKLLRLRDDLRRLFAQDSEEKDGTIVPGVDFDRLPAGVQEAMFDLGYNVIGFQEADIFPKMKIAIKKGDWEEAAKESRRKPSQVKGTRNAEIHELIRSAADELLTRSGRH